MAEIAIFLAIDFIKCYIPDMTIYDIAAEAGVSASTVSRVINKKSGIKPSTRKLVESLLEKYNYSPNEAARGLVSQNSRMIGILVSDIRNQHYTEGAYIIEQEFLSRGYCSLIFNTGNESSDKAEYVRLLAQRKVEGAVFIGSSFGTEEVKDAVSTYLSDIPIVIANGTLKLENISAVLADEKSGTAMLVEYLNSIGKKKIVYIDGEDTPSNHIKRAGYMAGMLSASLPSSVVIADNSYEGGLETMSALLACDDPPDAVICAVDLIAVGALRAVTDMGLRLPEDVSVFGIDNSPYSSISNPRLSSLDTHLRELSLCCARTLLDSLDGKEIIRRIVIPASPVIRES